MLLQVGELRFIYIGERFYIFLQSLDITGNMYQVSIYRGVLSLLVKFFRGKQTKFVTFHTFGKTNQETMDD